MNTVLVRDRFLNVLSTMGLESKKVQILNALKNPTFMDKTIDNEQWRAKHFV